MVTMVIPQKIDFPGFIPLEEACRCELHGFEIDLEGKVLVPSLCPVPQAGQESDLSESVRE